MSRRWSHPVVLFACLFMTACKPIVNFLAFQPDDKNIVPTENLSPDIKEIFFEAKDGVRLQALHLANPSSKLITIYFHGNAGNIYHRIRDFRRLRDLGTSILAASYRGYAKSEGSPSEEGIYLDAKAAFDYVTKSMDYPTSRVLIFGRSIGSAAAIELAQNKDIAGLILVTPLSNGREIASAMGLGFAASIAGGAFANDKKIKRVKAPLLVIHGTNDRVIPIQMGRKVFDAAAEPKVWYKIEGADHNDLSNRFSESYWTPIRQFVLRAISKSNN